MIPDFKTYIKESVWGGMLDRSVGDTVRKEDDVINMDLETFWLYLIAKYKDKVYNLDKDHFCREFEMDIVIDPIKDIHIYSSYVEDELARIMVVLTNRGTVRQNNAIKKIISSSPDNIRWIRTYGDRFEIELNNGEITNQTVIDLVEFFLSTPIFESVWGGMLDRSAGDTVRKEDNVNLLDQDELFDYIKSHYEVTRFVLDNDHKPIDKKNQISIPFAIPYEASNYGFCMSLEFNKNEKIITFGNSIGRDLPKVFKMICDNYRVERHTQLIDKLYPLDGSEITNQFYIDVIEFLIDNVEEDIKILKRI